MHSIEMKHLPNKEVVCKCKCGWTARYVSVPKMIQVHGEHDKEVSEDD
jgi:hypothetical protein